MTDLTASASDEGRNREPIKDLKRLSQIHSMSREDTSTKFREVLSLARDLQSIARGKRSIGGDEIAARKLDFFRKLSDLEESVQSDPLRAEVVKLYQPFSRIWDAIERRWGPKAVEFDPDVLTEKLAEYRTKLTGVIPESLKTELPAPEKLSDCSLGLREFLKSGAARPVNDLEIYRAIFGEVPFNGHQLEEGEARLLGSVRSVIQEKLMDLESNVQLRCDAWSEMEALGWKVTMDGCEMGPIPPKYDGDAKALLKLLGHGEAANYLKRQLRIRDRIRELERSLAEGLVPSGLFGGAKRWLAEQNLSSLRSSLQGKPYSLAVKDFTDNSRIPVLRGGYRSASVEDRVLHGIGYGFALRVLSLKIRWGSYQANLEGSTGNAILVKEDLGRIKERAERIENNYGPDFNRASLGKELFNYFAQLQEMRRYFQAGAAIVENERNEFDMLVAINRIYMIANSGESAETIALELQSAYEDFDKVVIGKTLRADLAAVHKRLFSRFVADYALSPEEADHARKNFPFWHGLTDGLDTLLRESYPRVFNSWLGCETHGLNGTPDADRYGEVPSLLYELSVSCPAGQAQWHEARKQIIGLCEIGALPSVIYGAVRFKELAQGESELRVAVNQPAVVDPALIADNLIQLRDVLLARFRTPAGSLEERAKHQAAIDALRESGVNVEIRLMLSKAIGELGK